MIQTFLKAMYHAYPVFLVISGIIAFASGAPLFKWLHSKSNSRKSGHIPNNFIPLGIIWVSSVVFVVAIIMFTSGCINQILCTEVPNVVGKSINNADLILERHDLRLELSSSQGKLSEPDYTIATQSPEAGIIVRKNSTVMVECNIGSESGPGPEASPTPDPTQTPATDPTGEPTPTPTPIPTPTPTPTPVPAQVDFTVSASYRIIPVPLTDKNCEISAYTSVEATRVTVVAVSTASASETYSMVTADGKSWTFNANFYIAGTYTVTVTAYGVDGATAQDSFSITYPFYNSLFN